MSIRPCLGAEVPALAARVARASNPAGTMAMWVRDRLDGLWDDGDFAGWYPRDGRPGLSPAQLATVCVLQFLLDLRGSLSQVVRGGGPVVRAPSNADFTSVFGSTIRDIRAFTHAPILLSETAIGPVAGAAKIGGLVAGVKADHLLASSGSTRHSMTGSTTRTGGLRTTRQHLPSSGQR
jgi:hypothetical protein